MYVSIYVCMVSATNPGFKVNKNLILGKVIYSKSICRQEQEIIIFSQKTQDNAVILSYHEFQNHTKLIFVANIYLCISFLVQY